MSKFKRFAAALLSAVMLVCALSIPVSAESIFDTAVSISSGKKYTKEVKKDQNVDYKISVSKSGTFVLKVNSTFSYNFVTVLDSDGGRMEPDKVEVKSGRSGYFQDHYDWDSKTEMFAATLTFDVEKGTYYIRVGNEFSEAKKGKVIVTATFPTNENAAKLTGIAVPLKKGETLQLSAATSASTKETITWSSSNTAVATVSKSGKVTAKKKGTAVITAQLGSNKASIVIQVTA